MEVIAAPETEIEAQWVARRILELAGPEPRFKDFAVLVRNTEVIPAFTDAFDAAGIPYLVNRGRGFYESREVNDLTHLLRVIANPRDEISLAVVLRSPLVSASDEALLRLKMTGENLGAALGAQPTTRSSRASRARLHEWRLRREYVTFDRLLLEAIDDCGYPASPNIDKFLGQARDAAARMSLDEFVVELAQVREENPREPDAPPEDSANAVEDHDRALRQGPGVPGGLRGRHAQGRGHRRSRRSPFRATSGWARAGAIRPAARIRTISSSTRCGRNGSSAKSRRAAACFYVAMTRAEQRLILSFSAGTAQARRTGTSWWWSASGSTQPCPRDRVVTYSAPDGKQWKARVLVAPRGAGTAHARRATPEEEVAMQFVPPPAVTDQQDSNATVTALALFAACPRKYYLGTLPGLRRPHAPRTADLATPSSARSPPSDFGTQVHALLAGTAVPSPDAEALRLADVFRQSPLGKRAARATRIEREFDFLMAVEDLVIRGQVDLWFEENGELVVVDYKTDDVTAAEAQLRAHDYALQLRLYAMAIERVAGRAPDRAWLHFLRPTSRWKWI